MKTLSKKDKRVVAVFGATGHTGRFVVAELSQRGMTPVAVARDAEALTNGSVLSIDTNLALRMVKPVRYVAPGPHP
jgi:short subunit dehydrogenase-like uncharacterized protein